MDYYKFGEFDYKDLTSFQSGMEHRMKSMGYDDFVSWIGGSNIRNFWKPKRLFVCAYIEYHANLMGIQVPDFVREFDGEKMDKLLFSEGIYLMMPYNFEDLEKCRSECKSEFLKRNLGIREVDNIY